jgi:hypothetical protein
MTCLHRSVIAAAILFFATPFVAVPDETKTATISIPIGRQSIQVTNTESCTDPPAILVYPGDDNTVKWVLGPGVTKFEIEFEVSPFKKGETHFNQDKNESSPIVDIKEKVKVFKYKIKVKKGYKCDPHVIIVKG